MYKHLFDFAIFINKKCTKMCKYFSFWVFFALKKIGISLLFDNIFVPYKQQPRQIDQSPPPP